MSEELPIDEVSSSEQSGDSSHSFDLGAILESCFKLAKIGRFYHKDIKPSLNTFKCLFWRNETCDLSAKTDGAFYLITGEVQRLILVAPDNKTENDSSNTLDFDAMEHMSVQGALQYIIQKCESPGIPGWDEFAIWTDNLMGQFMKSSLSSSVDNITIGDLSIPGSSLVDYPKNITNGSAFFSWLKRNLQIAEKQANTYLDMASCRTETGSYVLSLSIQAKASSDSGNLSMPSKIEVRK